MRGLRCIRYVTRNLLLFYLVGDKRKWSRISVAMLRLKSRPINGAPIQPRRRPSLEALPRQAERSKLIPEQVRWRFAVPSAVNRLLADMRKPIQEGSRGNDGGFGGECPSIPKLNAGDSVVIEHESRDLCLHDPQIRLIFKPVAHFQGDIVFCRTARAATKPPVHARYSRGEIESRLPSVSWPMMPPRASISRTRWPFAIPPIAGLHDICAMRSMFIVTIAVRRPRRAHARAASHPA